MDPSHSGQTSSRKPNNACVFGFNPAGKTLCLAPTADQQPSEVFQPGEQMLNLPPALVTTEFSPSSLHSLVCPPIWVQLFQSSALLDALTKIPNRLDCLIVASTRIKIHRRHLGCEIIWDWLYRKQVEPSIIRNRRAQE